MAATVFPVSRPGVGTMVTLRASWDAHDTSGLLSSDVARMVPWDLDGWSILEWSDEVRFVAPDGTMVGAYAASEGMWSRYECDAVDPIAAHGAPESWADVSAWIIGRVSILAYLTA